MSSRRTTGVRTEAPALKAAFVFFLLFLPAAFAHAQNTLLVDLTAYWKLEETSGARSDSHGSRHLIDNNGVVSAVGKSGNGADIERDLSQYLSLPNSQNGSLSPSAQDLTISAWVKYESMPSSSIGTIAGIYDSSSSQREWYFSYTNAFSGRTGWDGWASATGSSPVGGADSSHLPAVGTWYHVLFELDQTNSEIRITIDNGTVMVTSTSLPASIFDGSADFIIGALDNGTLGQVDSVIDEVAVWNRILSPADKVSLYNGGSGLFYDSFSSPADAYIDQINTLIEPDIDSVSADALRNWFDAGLQDGWYEKLDVTVFGVWSDAAANAVKVNDPNTSLIYNGTWTHGEGFIQGDGATAYIQSGITPIIDMATGSGFLATDILSTTGTSNYQDIASQGGSSTSDRIMLKISSGSEDLIFDYVGWSGGRVLTANSTRHQGIYAGNRNDPVRELLFYKGGAIEVAASNNGAAQGTLTDREIYFAASNKNGTPDQPSAYKYRHFTIGSGLTTAERDSYLQATWTLLEAITSDPPDPPIDPAAEALSYINKVEETVTLNQAEKDAINAWFQTAVDDGWYEKLDVTVFGVWGDAAANAVKVNDPNTSLIYNGTWTHGEGFIQGDGATAYIQSGITPNIDMATGSGFLATDILSTTGTSNYQDIASQGGNSTSDRIMLKISTGSEDLIFDYVGWSGGRVLTANSTRHQGIYAGNRNDPVRELLFYKGGGIEVAASNNGAAQGTLTDKEIYFAASNKNGTPDQPSAYKYRHFTIGSGLTTAERDSYLQATWTLLETIAPETSVDPAAAALSYINKVEESATLNQVEKDAINTWFQTAVSDGWYSNIKGMVLTVWGNAAADAVFVNEPATSGTWNGTVTHSDGYVFGDGSTGYFDFGQSPSGWGLDPGEAMLAWDITGADDFQNALKKDMGSRTALSDQFWASARHNNEAYFDAFSNNSGRISATYGGWSNSLYLANRNGTTREFIYHRNGANATIATATNSDAGSVNGQNVFAMARNKSGVSQHHTSRLYRMFSVGLGMTAAERDSFLTATNLLLNTVSYDRDALAYMIELEKSVTLTQADKDAVNTWFLAAKADDWYDKIGTAFFTVWGDATANAVDAVDLTNAGTWNGTITHADGYVEGGGTASDYFDIGVSPSSLGMTLSSAGLAVDIVGTVDAGAKTDLSSRQTPGSGSSQLLLDVRFTGDSFFWDDSNSSGGRLTGTNNSEAPGLFFGNREGTNRTLHHYDGTSIELGSVTGSSDSGSVPTQNLWGMLLNSSTSPSDRKYRMFLASSGMTPAERDSFLAATWTMLEAVAPATSVTFSGTITHGEGYIEGDGSTGHIRSTNSPTGFGLTAGSSMVAIDVLDASDLSSRNDMGSRTSASNDQLTLFIRRTSSNAKYRAFDAGGSADGTIEGDDGAYFNGIWIGNRLSPDRELVVTEDGTTLDILGSDTNPDGGISNNQTIYYMAFNNNGSLYGPTGRKYRMFTTGLGLTSSQRTEFLSDTATLLSSIAYDRDALAYMIELEKSVTLTQSDKDAINDFFVANKNDGLFNNPIDPANQLVRELVIGVWGDVAANSVKPLEPATSYTFNGSWIHNEESIQGDGATTFISNQKNVSDIVTNQDGHYSAYISTVGSGTTGVAGGAYVSDPVQTMFAPRPSADQIISDLIGYPSGRLDDTTVTQETGLWLANRKASMHEHLYSGLNDSAWTLIGSRVASDNQPSPAKENYFGSWNRSGQYFEDAAWAMFSAGRGMTTPQRDAFRANLAAFLSAVTASQTAPSWWTTHNILNTNPVNDFGPANVGQAKHLANAAYLEMEANFTSEGGAGPAISSLVNSWQTPGPNTNDFGPLNVGQVKNLAKMFYDRLVELNRSATPPWTTTTTDDVDHGIVTIGQLKNAFNFSLDPSSPSFPDTDSDGLDDNWEQQIINGDPNDSITTIAQVLPGDDFDGDGFTNYEEFVASPGTDPTDPNDFPGAGGPPPAAPSDLTATGISSSQINLSWTDNSSDETGFKIERKIEGGSFLEITTVAANSTSDSDTGLAASSSYTYRVRAYNGNGDSDYSNEAPATTQSGSADSDGDGLDDAWEILHFGNTAQGASGDPDLDGYLNIDEFNEGTTDPNKKDHPDITLDVINPLR